MATYITWATAVPAWTWATMSSMPWTDFYYETYPIAGADTVSVGMVGTPAVAGSLSRTDSLALVATESLVALLNNLSQSDTLGLVLSETPVVAGAATGVDTLALSLLESVSIDGSLVDSDSVSLALTTLVNLLAPRMFQVSAFYNPLIQVNGSVDTSFVVPGSVDTHITVQGVYE